MIQGPPPKARPSTWMTSYVLFFEPLLAPATNVSKKLGSGFRASLRVQWGTFTRRLPALGGLALRK